MRLPDAFQDQDKPDTQYAQARLDADAIVDTVLTALRYNESAVEGGARA
jgi:1-deoxy-D-xylulose-5-phosphate synthase